MINELFSDPRLLDEINRYCRIRKIARDETLMTAGDPIVFVPVVLEGVLRIVREDDEGREVFLYHLYPGQTCAMAINCCQSGKQSLVKAVAEADTSVLQIPVRLVEEWFRYPEWKAFVNNTYSNRFAELIQVIDAIAFHNLDRQLLRYLRERAKATGSNVLQLTHQEIAGELRTHREVISRLLRTMENKNLVRLGRNTVELLEA